MRPYGIGDRNEEALDQLIRESEYCLLGDAAELLPHHAAPPFGFDGDLVYLLTAAEEPVSAWLRQRRQVHFRFGRYLDLSQPSTSACAEEPMQVVAGQARLFPISDAGGRRLAMEQIKLHAGTGAIEPRRRTDAGPALWKLDLLQVDFLINPL